MTEIIVPVPEELKDRAELAARECGLTLDQLVRRLINEHVGKRAEDPLFANLSVYTGEAPADLSENHDDYLYGEKS